MQPSNIKIDVKFVLIVMFACYLPNVVHMPIWLSVFFISILVYRFFSAYYFLLLPNFWFRIGLILLSIFLLLWQHRILKTSGFYIGFFIMFTALKTLEVKNLRDLRVLILCNFYMILTVMLLNQELWIFFYVLLAVMLNLALMVKITAPQVDFNHTGKNFIKHFLYALPLSVLLFYLFPRLSHPLWSVPSLSQAKLGFSEELTIRNLSEMFNDDSTVMRVSFNKNFKPTLYWRGLVLSHFNGWSWKPELSDEYQFEQLKPLDASQSASYEILMEPHQKKWLFYQDNPIAAVPNLLFSSSAGLVQQDMNLVYYRLSYSLEEKPSVYQSLSNVSRQKYTHLPTYGNLKLRQWARQQFAAVHHDPQLFIGVIAQRINTQSYWYSLITENQAMNVNLMDKFWFETKRGYCEYYTSAVTIILRTVGIPARIILGYHGGKWNPVAQYLTVQQNDAHSWLEYWLDGVGWQRVDPVIFINPSRIDATIHQKQAEAVGLQTDSKLTWFKQMFFYLESTQFFWERWLLFYNADTQHDLLQKMGLQQWNGVDLLEAFIIVLVMFVIGVGGWYLLKQRYKQDAVIKEYHRLQHDLNLLGIKTTPPATVVTQLRELGEKYPQLKANLQIYLQQYEQLRLQQSGDAAENRTAILQLFKNMRKQLIFNMKK